ncbi:cytochrome P450 [Calocera cornea HHB12733]|uniref:Cytochrome P450 n=1 Tax=Calocera cornea HHB12733 TaxID=1353952 RepID=A0A165JB98_9BASI|nr:cytochrome P450 [Calocera cornea HHB12733]
MDNLFVLSLLAILLLLLRIIRSRGQPSRPLPPGPRGLPILGNLLQVPSSLLFLKLAEWAKEYGPIYSYSMAGQPIVVLNGVKEASDILDRCSALTSDRPRLIKLNQYLCRGLDFGIMPRNNTWRKHRRAAHEGLNIRVSKDYRPIQEEETRLLVEGLLLHPELDVVKHLHRQSSSLAWREIFGRESISLGGPDPSAPMEEIFRVLFLAMMPGGSFVDTFPFLNPLISRSKWIRQFYDETTTFFVNAFSEPQTETALRYFLVAMLLHPETASAARAQLDSVVGGRPPTFLDYDQLPQIEAMVKEVLRWRPPAPLGLPHCATEDIVYGDYLIPKGSIIFSNLWSIGRDPSVYPSGDAFKPSRFLTPSGSPIPPTANTHEDALAFGYGRRICVGKSVAMDTMWITVASLLWAFDFRPVMNEQGSEMLPDGEAFWDNGATVWPAKFGVRFIPRFEDLTERIKASVLE